MDVNGKKCWLFQGFFSRFTSKIIDVTELTQELNGNENENALIEIRVLNRFVYALWT